MKQYYILIGKEEFIIADSTISRTSILDAAEEVLRRFGMAKSNLSDVARALGVSHAAIYRHFDNKAALREAMAERWLNHVMEPLNAIVANNDEPEIRLRSWLDTLRAFKRSRALTDPELFAMYMALTAEAADLLHRHVEDMLEQLTVIIADGIAAGVFAPCDARESARAFYLATTRFHHPSHAGEWELSDSDINYEITWKLLMNGLTIRS
ncbi:TetR family transcriptional regulator [Paenibacillus sepulcri]|uniref:TetR family transcriptional regulator n=1 Tax=Paenibacillus sepulcri TaxID=359917 RepID=A0ABS7C6Y3_9BACL|nr:TetR family transcriptional regulator [Paenibacillus sepulcri]